MCFDVAVCVLGFDEVKVLSRFSRLTLIAYSRLCLLQN